MPPWASSRLFFQHRSQDGQRKDAHDNEQGDGGRYLRHPWDVLAAIDKEIVLMQRVQQELDTDEREDETQPVGQVHQAIEQTVEQEVHLTQTHEGERVGGEYQKCLGGDAVDRRNGVEGEHDVHHADGYERDEQRSEPAGRSHPRKINLSP